MEKNRITADTLIKQLVEQKINEDRVRLARLLAKATENGTHGKKQ